MFQTTDDIIEFVAGQPVMTEVLGVVKALGLPDCWVGAGFVRNAIWDALHHRPWSASYGDIDVVYFDAGNLTAEKDHALETELNASKPNMPWSVKNQARMHVANGDPPYADTADALRHWPETCTAIALRSNASQIELLAPFGISDLVSLVVSPTDAFAHKMDRYRARVRRKQWTRHWPNLRINGLGPE